MNQEEKDLTQPKEKQKESEIQDIIHDDEKQDMQEECEGDLEALEDEQTALEEKVTQLESECSELRENFLRKQADIENYRKRMIRDKEEAIRYANRDLLQDLIPVIDDFERAISSAQESKDFSSFYEGIKLIEKQFAAMLEKKWGLKRMKSLNQEFDPQQHEALMVVESDDFDTQTVVEDFQRGYFFHDKVIRHAKVKVAMPAKNGEES